MSTQTFKVAGMTCQHCVASVQEELGELPGVSNVDVSLETGRVTVTSDEGISEEAAGAAVQEAGYTVAEWNQA